MIIILIPTYNEENNIKELSLNLKNLILHDDRKYIFVDDCSTDNTIYEIEKNFDISDLIIIKKESNKGPGDSFNLGFEWILENIRDENCFIVTMECDNTTDYSILNEMLKLSFEGYDLVLSSIYMNGGEIDKTNKLRIILSHIANGITKKIFRLNYNTLSSFYRVYKLSLIKEIKNRFKYVAIEKGFTGVVEILIKANLLNSRIIEVPATLYSSKRAGKSKMKILTTIKDYFNLFAKYKDILRNDKF